ncbi:brachyurin-like [Bradysia coprophila]|uniref:brachyurin-like n=1 Tax=Bradysia coprophila TaxID=38358 RepID=UPI00187D77C8|nr:brachyurin-like [Bradysia coprophila]
MNVKFVLILCTLFVCGLTARLPKVRISTFRESTKTSASRNSATRAIVGRIANGQPANQNQIPHQCVVLSPVGRAFSLCGGSIISAEWVLTAAHCAVGYYQYNLRFGSITSTIGGQVQTSFESISHPDYNSKNLNNDIAIISIPTPLTFSPSIQSIRLPTNSQIGSTFRDVSAVVSGWGTTSHGSSTSQTLNWAGMRVISNGECSDVFGADVVVDHVVCATGSGGPTQGHCPGDSGSPLTILEGGVRTQIGVVSFGAAAGCDLLYPSGYMRTANFIHWINEQTGIAVRP